MFKFLMPLVIFLITTVNLLGQVSGYQACDDQAQIVIKKAVDKDQEGNSDEAFKILEEMLTFPMSEKCKALIMLKLGELGNKHNQIVKGAKYLKEANKIFEQNDMYDQQITVNNMIGGSYYLLGDYEITVKHTLRAIKIAKENERRDRLDILYNNLAGAFGALRNYDSALKYVEIAINISDNNNHRKSLLHSLSTKAEILLQKGNYLAAEKEFKKVLNLIDSLKFVSPYLRAVCLYGLADCNFNKDKYSIALELGKESLQLTIESQHLYIAEQTAKLLSKIWDELGNIDSAYYYQSLYVDLQEKIKPAENLSRLNKFQMREAEQLITAKEKEAEKQKYFTLLGSTIAALLFLLFITIFLFFRNSKKLNKQLKDKNETIGIVNNQLAQQRDELDNLNKLKDKIFSAVIHDFKTPLNTIEGMLNMLIKKYMTPEEAASNARKLLVILTKSRLAINSTIAWIKTQFDGYKTHKQPIQLKSFIEEIISYHHSDLQKKGINIDTVMEEDIQFASDKELLFIILNNLITNAIKFSNSDGAIQIITTEDHDQLKITVEDKGIGMQQSELDRLFSFESNSTKGTSAEIGSGLGLMICKELIMNLDGKITAESEKGIGTAVTIYIPLEKIVN